MASKLLKFSEDARRSLEAGVNKLADTIALTSASRPQRGPGQEVGAPITNDGVTIAKEVELEDPWENMGPSSPRRSPPRRTTSPVTAPRRRPCSHARWSTADAQRRGGREPDGAQARHREGRHRGRRRDQGPGQGRRLARGHLERRLDLRSRSRDRRRARRGARQGRQGRCRDGGGRTPSAWSSSSSRACSSTRATSRRTS